MAETLLSVSGILLYGRKMVDLEVKPENIPNGGPKDPARNGDNLFLSKQLKDYPSGDPQPTLARMYGFSYEGHYYDLAKPIVFLVHGDGVNPESLPGSMGAEYRMARGPDNSDLTGVATQFGSFSSDIKVWAYDKGDFTIRMDIETGPFERILLDAELNSERLRSHYSGQKVRIRNSRYRSPED